MDRTKDRAVQRSTANEKSEAFRVPSYLRKVSRWISDWTAALLAGADGQDERQSGAAQHREREKRSISSAVLLKKSKKKEILILK